MSVGAVTVVNRVRKVVLNRPGTQGVQGPQGPIAPYGASLVLVAGYTPLQIGADAAEVVVPAKPDGSSATWTIGNATFRVSAAGGAPELSIEKSSGGGAFVSSGTLATLAMPDGGHEVTVPGSGTVVTGDAVRLNVTSLGTATGWTVSISLTANP